MVIKGSQIYTLSLTDTGSTDSLSDTFYILLLMLTFSLYMTQAFFADLSMLSDGAKLKHSVTMLILHTSGSQLSRDSTVPCTLSVVFSVLKMPSLSQCLSVAKTSMQMPPSPDFHIVCRLMGV